MGVATLLGRGRQAPEEPLALLLADPATVGVAADALARTERADDPAWPLVVTVGREHVSLYWAGLTAPAAHEPWRAGEDPRRWIADRAEIAATAGPEALRPIVVGRDGDALVFVNVSRAPGPLTVEAAVQAAPRHDVLAALVELVARQQPDVDRGGAWWPVDVAGEAVALLGTPIGTTLPVGLMRRAGEAAGTPVRTSVPVPVPAVPSAPAPVPAPATAPAPAVAPAPSPAAPPPPPPPVQPPQPRDEVFEEWLRQVRMAVAGGVTLGREAEPVRQALPVAPPVAEPVDAPVAEPAVEDTAELPKIVVADEVDEDDLEDWAADFAVSSADG